MSALTGDVDFWLIADAVRYDNGVEFSHKEIAGIPYADGIQSAIAKFKRYLPYSRRRRGDLPEFENSRVLQRGGGFKIAKAI